MLFVHLHFGLLFIVASLANAGKLWQSKKSWAGVMGDYLAYRLKIRGWDT
jgi:hypothetical protein